MDSQHRHQLQQNDLRQLTLQAKPWLEQHGAKLLVAVVGVLAVVLGASAYLNSQSESKSEAWSKLTSAKTVDEFGKVADQFPESLAATWSRLRMGELNLESGVAAMFTDRELALKDLQAAKKEFELVLSAKVELPDSVRERAMYGLARCLEAQCDGDTGPAIDAYEALLKRNDRSIYKTQVTERIKDLKSPATQQFYAWFHKQSPKPAGFARPQDGKPGTTPAGDPSGLPPSAAPQSPAPAEKSSDDKAAPDAAAKPAEETPADVKPADEKPTTEKAAPPTEPKSP